MGRPAKRTPVARSTNEFILEDLGAEVLVYDQVHHRAHCLTTAAAMVWKRCDGRTGLDELRALLAKAGATESLETVLTQLEGAGLIRAAAPRRVDRSRRALLRRGAVAAAVVAAAPVVFSIVAPSVAEAASVCGGAGQACCTNKGQQCKGGLRCQAGICQ